jgi:hypothetical protein
MNTEHWWNDNWHGKTEVLGDEPAPEPLCPPLIPSGLLLERTRTHAVRVFHNGVMLSALKRRCVTAARLRALRSLS